METRQECPISFLRCDCQQHEKVLCRKVASNGSRLAGYQCLNCGRMAGRVSTRDLDDWEDLPEFDESICRTWQGRQQKRNEQIREWWSRRYEAQREAESEAWWRRYNAHLASPKWRALRQKVLARSRGVCEGCGDRPATDIHHLTYERLGDEMLFDLAAVCLRCHEKIHGGPVRG